MARQEKEFTIKITLSDDQIKFMEWVRRNDNYFDPENPIDFNTELSITLGADIYRLMEEYWAAYKANLLVEVK